MQLKAVEARVAELTKELEVERQEKQLYKEKWEKTRESLEKSERKLQHARQHRSRTPSFLFLFVAFFRSFIAIASSTIFDASYSECLLLVYSIFVILC